MITLTLTIVAACMAFYGVLRYSQWRAHKQWMAERQAAREARQAVIDAGWARCDEALKSLEEVAVWDHRSGTNR